MKYTIKILEDCADDEIIACCQGWTLGEVCGIVYALNNNILTENIIKSNLEFLPAEDFNWMFELSYFCIVKEEKYENYR